jgi:hypothetical protein
MYLSLNPYLVNFSFPMSLSTFVSLLLICLLILYLSIYLSLRISLCMCLYIVTSLSLSLSVCLSVCLSLSHLSHLFFLSNSDNHLSLSFQILQFLFPRDLRSGKELQIGMTRLVVGSSTPWRGPRMPYDKPQQIYETLALRNAY